MRSRGVLNIPVIARSCVVSFWGVRRTLWRNCVFKLCGVENFVRRMYGPVSNSTSQERAGWLSEVARLVKEAAEGDPREATALTSVYIREGRIAQLLRFAMPNLFGPLVSLGS